MAHGLELRVPYLDREVMAVAARLARQEKIGQALFFGRRYGQFARLALVNGAAGVVAAVRGRPVSVLGVTVRGGKIAEIDILADPARLRQLDLAHLDD